MTDPVKKLVDDLDDLRHAAYRKQADDLAKELAIKLAVNVKFKKYEDGLYIYEIPFPGDRRAHHSICPKGWWKEIRRHGFRMMHLEVDWISGKLTFEIGYSPYRLVVINE